MTPEQFCYWLQGYFEISGSQEITEKSAVVIRDHLKLVFDKQTPDRGITFHPGPVKHDFITGTGQVVTNGIEKQPDFICNVVNGVEMPDDLIYRESPSKVSRFNFKHKKQYC